MTLDKPIDEAVDPKEFIMGYYGTAVTELLQRDFFQNPVNDMWYSKVLPNKIIVGVQLGGVVDKGPYDDEAYVNVLREQHGTSYEFWVAVVPQKLIGKAVDKVVAVLEPLTEADWNDLLPEAVAKRKEVYKALDALVPHGRFMPEAVDPREFILVEGLWMEFKTRMEELGWTYTATKEVPTAPGYTIKVHEMDAYFESYRFASEGGHVSYTAYISEFEDRGQRRLSVHADGIKHFYTGKWTSIGGEKTEEVPFDIVEQIQPDNMSGAEFAEVADDVIRSNTGPMEAPPLEPPGEPDDWREKR